MAVFWHRSGNLFHSKGFVFRSGENNVKSEFAAVGLRCPLVLQLQTRLEVWRGDTELGWGLQFALL